MTTTASRERRTPLLTIAVINKVTQGQAIFLFSKELKPSPEPAKAPI